MHDADSEVAANPTYRMLLCAMILDTACVGRNFSMPRDKREHALVNGTHRPDSQVFRAYNPPRGRATVRFISPLVPWLSERCRKLFSVSAWEVPTRLEACADSLYGAMRERYRV